VETNIKNKVTLLNADGWTGFYINKILISQKHSFSAKEVLTFVKDIGPFEIENLQANLEWLADIGNFPETLDKVILENESFSQKES